LDTGFSVSIDNSILDGNMASAPNYTGPLDVSFGNGATVNDSGFNLLGTSDKVAGTFTKTSDIYNNNTGLANALAVNGALPNYPMTLALSTTSPGYQKGDFTLAGMADPLGIDARGLTREFDPSNNEDVSIGAYDPDAD
jgi:hypothetical protein